MPIFHAGGERMSGELNLSVAGDLLDRSGDDELGHLSDEVLITRLLDGNPNALAVLFDRYYRMVLSIALRIIRDAGEAEDLMQSVFLSIFRFAKEFDSARGTVKMWILQSAYNQAFNRRRYLNLRGIYSHRDDLELTDRSSVCNGHSLGQAELAQAVREALMELRKSQRQVVEYAFYEGLTMREIAVKTCKTFHSVRHDYYRALEKLKWILVDAPATAPRPVSICVTGRFQSSTRPRQATGPDDCNRTHNRSSAQKVCNAGWQ
jgi:RNA polymerase sigma-70 factor (ECF subfamily)